MLRNREIKRFALWYGGISLAAVGIGFWLSVEAGLLAIALAAALGTAFFFFTRARYQRLAQMADGLDHVLHHDGRGYIASMDEGETAILESEIAKMTLRLQEQNEALKTEKSRLADSLADIAHQLRTPLTSLNLVLSLLEKQPEESERRALLREMGSLLAQMDWLVSSLLKLSRLDAGVVAFQSAPFFLEALMDAAARPLLISAELHDIRLDIAGPAEAQLVGDMGWLSEAVRNLLKNSMESVGDHGSVSVSWVDNPLYTEIAIRDSGPGFDPEELPRLFERFYRGKGQNAAGYGIGLALCKSVVSRQGGTVTARNHPQGGALFLLRFSK